MAAANGTLAATRATQDQLVAAAGSALTLVQTSGVEQQLANTAKQALSAYQAAGAGVLQGLQAAFDRLASTAEAAAFGAANASLQLAQANTKDINLAKSAVDFAGKGANGVLDAGNWVASHSLNILNIRSVDVSGDLRGLLQQGKELNAHVVGTFAEKNVDVSVNFSPGKGEEMAKNLFQQLMNDVDKGVMKIL